MSLGHEHRGHAHDQTALIDALTGARGTAAVGRQVRRSVNASMGVNVGLSILQIIVGWLAHSQSLLVDGFHSLSDLLSDVLVLFVARHSRRAADEQHPYGHARLETLATLILGVMLMVIGGGFLYSAAERAVSIEETPPVEMMALYVALAALLSKEWLFHYLMRVAKQANSAMLMANAWHSRSDAASSLVVAIGIGGSLLGFIYADLLAAAIVGALIVKMGWQFSRSALEEFIDKGADTEKIQEIRRVITETPGVIGLHDLRTRRMADRILVDAHVLVSPRISVSEGHRTAELARQRVREICPDVLGMLVHIDPEDDPLDDGTMHQNALDRAALTQWLERESGRIWGEGTAWTPERIELHYLNGRVEVEIMLPPITGEDPGATMTEQQMHNLRTAAATAALPVDRWVVYRRLSPQ